MNRLEFQSLAVERLDDAAALLKSGRYACAYYISGYAVECALKACIARQTKQDEFPPKDAAKCYVHDIRRLLDIAGLEKAFSEEAKLDPSFGENWTVVKDWSEESRYQSRRKQQAQDILDAIDDPQQWSAPMVKNKLVEGLIGDGAKLLRELDRQGFPVESMFWVHLPEEEYWRLVIASPFVTQRGGAVGYRRLNELMRNLDFAGITLDDVYLLDPESSQFQSLYSVASGSSRLAAGPAWLEFEDAVVYRWTGASVSAELGCEVSAGELLGFWEAAREDVRLSYPDLLIGKEAGRVTLRFHPKQGPQESIDGIKAAFVTALHRPGARPGCQVNWLD